jgi:hypothetical protein
MSRLTARRTYEFGGSSSASSCPLGTLVRFPEYSAIWSSIKDPMSPGIAYTGNLVLDFHFPPSPTDQAALFESGASVPLSGTKKIKARSGSFCAADKYANVQVGDIHGAMAMKAKFPPRGKFEARVALAGTKWAVLLHVLPGTGSGV